MLFENLSILRVIAHEVFTRDDDREVKEPEYGTSLVILRGRAMDTLRDRVVSALGRASKSVEMEIANREKMADLASSLIPLGDRDYLEASKQAARRLAEAQTSRRIPGGVLLVVHGEVGYPAQPFICLIKAESQDGFLAAPRGELSFLEKLILTPQTKLYKIGVFVRNPTENVVNGSDYRVFLHDDTILAQNRQKTAAQYFYESFLGFRFPESSARLTRDFFVNTRDFVDGAGIPSEQKSDLISALHSYVKQGQSQIVSISEFGSQFMSSDMREPYERFMSAREFPDRAIQKDTSEVAPMLKVRSVRFPNNIRFSAPADLYAEKVQIKSVSPEDNGATWTEILVKDAVVSQA